MSNFQNRLNFCDSKHGIIIIIPQHKEQLFYSVSMSRFCQNIPGKHASCWRYDCVISKKKTIILVSPFVILPKKHVSYAISFEVGPFLGSPKIKPSFPPLPGVPEPWCCPIDHWRRWCNPKVSVLCGDCPDVVTWHGDPPPMSLTNGSPENGTMAPRHPGKLLNLALRVEPSFSGEKTLNLGRI